MLYVANVDDLQASDLAAGKPVCVIVCRWISICSNGIHLLVVQGAVSLTHLFGPNAGGSHRGPSGLRGQASGGRHARVRRNRHAETRGIIKRYILLRLVSTAYSNIGLETRMYATLHTERRGTKTLGYTSITVGRIQMCLLFVFDW